ncbi:MAG: tol-pal system-associated acyl-CoA thioesterase [Amaricoccus sp.]|uniref:tol-pal system-associated acyl-CoA thioesterase n=1 Tax=Amaricoccus sp. TaxID=1872485 RepID=UPI0039E2D9A5
MRVYYEDTDAAGIVYYANYLKFIERARTEALLAIGFRQTELRARYGLVFAVREITVRYLAPARLEDQLVVRTASEAPRGARLEMAQEIWRGDTLLVRARVTLACLGPDGRPLRIPADVADALTRLATV